VATVHAAIDAGITMLDLAPGYGVDAESERATGEALRTRPAPDVMITTKVPVPGGEGDIPARMRRSLHDSLERIGRDQVDLLLLHTQLLPRDEPSPERGLLAWREYREEVVPEFQRLQEEGLIRGWGITGVGHPATVLDALREAPRPDAVQVVVNALDLSGDIWMFDGVRSANDAVLRVANGNGVAAIGIRAVAAGSLTSAIDRPVAPDHRTAVDFVRAEPFRKLAAEIGETPAALAHRYALSVPGVATVVLGVKNRVELQECVAAEARGPLGPQELEAVAALS
jgi:aryl-alcohol dehydrogenase-like predicted oxidoreductase